MVTKIRRDVVALEATSTREMLERYIEQHYIEKQVFHHTIMDYSEMDIPSTRPFSTYLFSLMDTKQIDDVRLYKKAQIDRRLFSKMRSNKDYQPSKKTVFKFILALELNYQEAKELLEYAGFSFSRSSQFDLIVEFSIKHEIYNIDTVNELLYSYVEEAL